MLEELTISWLVVAIIVGVAAAKRCNRSGFGWFLLSVVISPLLAGLLLIALGPKKPPPEINPPKQQSFDWGKVDWTPGGLSVAQIRARDALAETQRANLRRVVILVGVGVVILVMILGESVAPSVELQSQPKQPVEQRIAGYGSGFFITNAGHIVTNWHVVKNCRSLTAANG